MRLNSLRSAALVILLAAAVLAFGCGGDDDETADETADAAHTAEGHAAPAGVVGEKPADAVQVDVTLREWAVAASPLSVEAGTVYFLAENTGPDHPHELVVIRTDLGPLDLPFEDNAVPEDQVEVVDEIEEFAPHSSASLPVDLTPGAYLLICNISEDDPEIGSHYKKGMVAAFTVE